MLCSYYLSSCVQEEMRLCTQIVIIQCVCYDLFIDFLVHLFANGTFLVVNCSSMSLENVLT